MYAYLGRRKWQPTPVILPGEHHEQRSLAGYSPWGCKESGMTEQLSFIHSYLGTSTYAKIKSISSTSEGPSAPLTANTHLPCPALCSSGLCHRRLMSTVLQLHTVEPDRTYALYSYFIHLSWSLQGSPTLSHESVACTVSLLGSLTL